MIDQDIKSTPIDAEMSNASMFLDFEKEKVDFNLLQKQYKQLEEEYAALESRTWRIKLHYFNALSSIASNVGPKCSIDEIVRVEGYMHPKEAPEVAMSKLRDNIIADYLHYPLCWDTVTYPTLESAALEGGHCRVCDYHEPLTAV
jgi:hypothetical protein